MGKKALKREPTPYHTTEQQLAVKQQASTGAKKHTKQDELRTLQTAQQLRASAAFTENLSLSPITHTRWLTTTFNSNSRGLETFGL